MASVPHGCPPHYSECPLNPVHLSEFCTGGSPCGWPLTGQLTRVFLGDLLGEESPITTPIPKHEVHVGPRTTSSSHSQSGMRPFCSTADTVVVPGGCCCPSVLALPSLLLSLQGLLEEKPLEFSSFTLTLLPHGRF